MKVAFVRELGAHTAPPRQLPEKTYHTGFALARGDHSDANHRKSPDWCHIPALPIGDNAYAKSVSRFD